jgi:hypothetical protein
MVVEVFQNFDWSELIAAGKAAAQKLAHASILLKAGAAPGGPAWADGAHRRRPGGQLRHGPAPGRTRPAPRGRRPRWRRSTRCREMLLRDDKGAQKTQSIRSDRERTTV